MSRGRSSPLPIDEQGTHGFGTQGRFDWKGLDELLEELPPGIPLLSPEDAGNFEKYTHRPPHAYVPGEGWKNCARALETYDAELCKGYREELDTLLVFAGLFSAVVTAFAIESYQWLQADANDTIIVLLAQVARSVSPNNTAAPVVPASAGLPGSVSVRVNTYWFLALAISLSAALVAILCKQWIREFERKVGLSPSELVAIHQLKLEGLETWRVGDIISCLPLLLQVALALFAVGMLELLWQLHSVVAAVVCVPTISSFLFYAATTMLPAMHQLYLDDGGLTYRWHMLTDCPYKSPQALITFSIAGFCFWIRDHLSQSYRRLVAKFIFHRRNPSPYNILPLGIRIHVPEWNSISRSVMNRQDVTYHRRPWDPRPLSAYPLLVYRGLRWININIDNENIWEWVWRCLWELSEDNPRLGWQKDSLKRGLSHVVSGSTDIPDCGPHALTLGYLLSSSAGQMFAAEACIQHLGKSELASAEYLLKVFADMHHSVAPQAAVSIFRVAHEYLRFRMHEPIGDIIASATRLVVACSDTQIRRMLAAGMLFLCLNWLSVQPIPHQSATAAAMANLAVIHFQALLDDPDDYGAHPELLLQRPGVRQMAELLRMYSHLFGDPSRSDVVHEIVVSLPYASPERNSIIVHALLAIDNSLNSRDDTAPSHCDTPSHGDDAVQRIPDLVDSKAPNPDHTVHPGALQRGDGPQGTRMTDESPASIVSAALAVAEHPAPAVHSVPAAQHEPAGADDSAGPSASVLRCATMHTDHEAENGRPRVEDPSDARLIAEDRGDTMHPTAPLYDVEDLT